MSTQTTVPEIPIPQPQPAQAEAPADEPAMVDPLTGYRYKVCWRLSEADYPPEIMELSLETRAIVRAEEELWLMRKEYAEKLRKLEELRRIA